MWVYLLYKLGGFFSCFLPSSLAYYVAKGLADLCFLMPIGKYRLYKKAAFNNVSLVLGRSENDPLVRKTVVGVYRNFAKYLREFLWLPGLNQKKIFRLVTPLGVENLDCALSKRKGAILLSTHFGNWEWGGISLALSGYKVNFLVRAHKNKKTDRLFNHIREKKGIKIIPLTRLKEGIKVLKKNEILAILADENLGQTMKAELFSREVDIPSGPFRLARKTEAMITPAFIVRDRWNGRQKGIVEAPLEVKRSQSEERDLQEAINSFIQIMEDYLRYYPDHWLLLEPKGEFKTM
ncbi:MAG: lysophospholipid acyltransferase family protein [bacterium]